MTIVLIAVALYAVATTLLVRTLARGLPTAGAAWAPPAMAAAFAHGYYHYLAWMAIGGADLRFFAALSLTGLGMSLLTLMFAVRGKLAALCVIVFPIAGISLAGYGLSGQYQGELLGWRLQLHAWFALMAYATLGIAALVAVLSWIQERALRRHQIRGWLRSLPPLTELELLLFRIIAVGFILLTATLLTGVLFVSDFFAQHLMHKTVLSVMSWIAFGALLFGRWRYGLRGARAVGLTVTAMALLVLAFFGSKFVLELVLQRT